MFVWFVCCLKFKKSFGFYIISCSITKRVYFAERSKNKIINPSSSRVEQNYTRNLLLLGKRKDCFAFGHSPKKIFTLLWRSYSEFMFFASSSFNMVAPLPSFFPNSARHVNIPFFLNLFIFTICVKSVFFSTNKTKFY